MKKKKVKNRNKSLEEEIDESRKNAGLPALKEKKKTCCKCSKVFVTRSKDICCPQCRSSNNNSFEYYGHYGSISYE